MQFQRVRNFRDLGELTTADGRRVRPRRIFRSAGIASATESDLAELRRAHGINTVVDLRTAEERALFGAAPAVFPRIVELPLVTQADLDRSMSWERTGDSYRAFLADRVIGERIVATLELFADEQMPPVLVCCSAGKDRTGLVVAALLGAIGVSDETIAEDYAASRVALAAMYAEWAKHPASGIGELLETRPHLLDAPAEEMARLLDWLRRMHGSMGAFLAAHGATDALVTRLRCAYLDEERLDGSGFGGTNSREPGSV